MLKNRVMFLHVEFLGGKFIVDNKFNVNYLCNCRIVTWTWRNSWSLSCGGRELKVSPNHYLYIYNNNNNHCSIMIIIIIIIIIIYSVARFLLFRLLTWRKDKVECVLTDDLWYPLISFDPPTSRPWTTEISLMIPLTTAEYENYNEIVLNYQRYKRNSFRYKL